jgi:hypothetical protein
MINDDSHPVPDHRLKRGVPIADRTGIRRVTRLPNELRPRNGLPRGRVPAGTCLSSCDDHPRQGYCCNACWPAYAVRTEGYTFSLAIYCRALTGSASRR